MHERQLQVRHLQQLVVRQVYQLQQTRVVNSVLAHSFDLFYFLLQVFDLVKLHFFVKLVQNLLVILRNVRVSIAQIIQNVPKVSSVPINEVSAIFIFCYIMPSRKHGRQHRVRIASAKSILACLEKHSTY